ncbi:hypothetical protein DMN91_008136 [Ooceraea biroi]|uniref:Ferric-chelate reductase 1-like protein n=1 Tax=Ooceraea biroi TaxID=2015173 RepID=A0A3L8DI27_OOCBI|nr:hypothetical protein DMN91_008136 [Ooceraea biroi]
MKIKMPRTLLLLIIGLLAKVLGLPNGAPPEACYDLMPRHSSGSLQSSYPPYQVLPAPGQGRVRLTLGSPQGLPYEGFMIIAKDINTGENVGDFANLPDSARYLECTQGTKNGVTHTNTQKKHNLVFDWQAPIDYEGTIIFNSTFAQDYSTYWVGVESAKVAVSKRSIDVLATPPPVITFRTTTPPFYRPTVDYATKNEEDPFYAGCHTTKNCFGAPAGCIKTKDCIAVVAVIVRGDQYIFEMQARRNAKYVAVGLSDDKNMGDDSVVECTNEGDEIALHMSWNTGKRNTRHATPEGAVQLESGTTKDDVIHCRFRRDKLTVVHGRTYDLVNTPYHLLVVAGTDLRRNGVDFHDLVYLGTSSSKRLSDVGEWTAASDILIRLHGALMLASWIGTASIGMLLARYYRQTWVNSQLCGKDHWFAVIIALFFAVRLNKAKLPDWVDWILTAYVVFHVLTHLILTFLGCASDRQVSQRVNSFPMKDMHSRGSMVHPDARRDAPHSGMRKFIFGVYFVVIVMFAAALIVITVLAPIEETWATFTNTISNY